MESASTAGSVAASAATATVSATLLEAFAHVLSKQNILDFLESRVGMDAQKNDFCGWLNRMFPYKPDLHYASMATDLFPGVDECQISSNPAKILHVSAFGFRHTPKVPLSETCVKLAERILTEGFVTGAEPVLIMNANIGGAVPPLADEHGHLLNMFTQYYKGQNRCVTLLALLVLLWEDGAPWVVNPGSELQPLFDSVGAINVCAVNVASLSSWVIGNASFAARGSIRKAWNVVQWMAILKSFERCTSSDPKIVIKAWNEKSVKSQQLVGAKRMALVNLLGYPSDVQGQIFETVSCVGWARSPYTEDLLGSKKILPGAKRTQGPKSWQNLSAISQGSLSLFVRHLHYAVMGDTYARLSKAELEDLAVKIAIGYNLVDLACQDFGIPRGTLEKKWLEQIVAGSPEIMAELHSVMMEKKENVKPCELRCMDLIITEWKAAQTANLSSPALATYMETARLEEDAFQLLLKRVTADVQSYTAWQKRCLDLRSAVYFNEKQFRMEKYNQAREIAQRWISEHMGLASAEDNERDLTKNLKETTCSFFARHTSRDMEAKFVVNLNWAAPGLVRAELQTVQKNLASMLLHDAPEQNVVVMVTPKFSYQPGTLWVQMVSVLNWAGQNRLNCDLPFSILFKQRHHQADQRPLNYDGRFLFAGNLNNFLTKSMWRSSTLVDKGFVAGVDQLKSQDVRKIEYLEEDSLPQMPGPQDDRAPVAAKYSQLGDDAYKTLLQALLDGNHPSNAGVVIVDLSTGSGDCMRAYVDVIKSSTVPLWYWGVAESGQHREWLQEQLLDIIIQDVRQYKLGNLSKEDHAPVLELPAKPALLQCVWGGPADNPSLHMAPQELIAWTSRADSIKTFAEGIQKETGVATLMQEPFPNVAETPKPAKHPMNDGEDSSPLKRSRGEVPAQHTESEALQTEPVAEISEKVLCEMKLTQAPTGTMWEVHILAGNRLVLINNDVAASRTLPAGFMLMGYGKGKWVQKKPEEDDGESDIPFILKTSNDRVIFNGRVVGVGSLVAAHAVDNPAQAKVCYHDLVEMPQPGDPGAFELKRRLHVATQSLEQQPAQATENALNIPWTCGAAIIPLKMIQESSDLEILFTVKWTKKGLQPMGPFVTLKNTMTVGAKQAYFFT